MCQAMPARCKDNGHDHQVKGSGDKATLHRKEQEGLHLFNQFKPVNFNSSTVRTSFLAFQSRQALASTTTRGLWIKPWQAQLSQGTASCCNSKSSTRNKTCHQYTHIMQCCGNDSAGYIGQTSAKMASSDRWFRSASEAPVRKDFQIAFNPSKPASTLSRLSGLPAQTQTSPVFLSQAQLKEAKAQAIWLSAWKLASDFH